MIRKLIATTAALSTILFAGSAMAQDLQPYKQFESGPIVVVLTPQTCTGDCAAVRDKVLAAAARHTDVSFRELRDENEKTVCIDVTAGPKGTIVSVLCDVTDSDGIKAYLDREVAFAKRVQPLVADYEAAKDKLDAAKAPFVAEADKLNTEAQAALAPIQQKSATAMDSINAAKRDLELRKKAALRAAFGGEDPANIDVSKLGADQLAAARQKYADAIAPFADETAALHQREIETMSPIITELEQTAGPYRAKLVEIEQRMNVATSAELLAATTAMRAMVSAISDNNQVRP